MWILICIQRSRLKGRDVSLRRWWQGQVHVCPILARFEKCGASVVPYSRQTGIFNPRSCLRFTTILHCSHEPPTSFPRICYPNTATIWSPLCVKGSLVKQWSTKKFREFTIVLPTRKSQSRRFLSNAEIGRLITERQVCLVTGAARGLGNEFCRAFMRS